jgi:hypothetical protein
LGKGKLEPTSLLYSPPATLGSFLLRKIQADIPQILPTIFRPKIKLFKNKGIVDKNVHILAYNVIL